MSQSAALPLPRALTEEDEAALTDLWRRGTPANTLRAWEGDLLYVAAWKRARLDAPLAWPEAPRVALRFVLDHGADLSAATGPARAAAEVLIAAGRRRSLACPAPATLDRRIASWRAFHRTRDLPDPFAATLVAEARRRARRAAARPHAPKSPRPITREVLETLLASCDGDMRGRRDRAMLALGFASGGRRRSELAALTRADIATGAFAESGVIWLRLRETKTTGPAEAPRLPVRGRAARAVIGWIETAGIADGPLLRPVSAAGRVLGRGLSADGIRVILRRRLEAAGLPPDYASAHGLRAGFLTQAALDGVPLPAAMALSLHRSPAQAQRYYADVEIEANPATGLLE